MNDARRVDLSFPHHVDGRGKLATASYARHVYEMIEQVLFTLPGERVNRPQFGSQVPFFVFQTIRPDAFIEVQSAVELALQTWMRDVITLQGVNALNQTMTESFSA